MMTRRDELHSAVEVVPAHLSNGGACKGLLVDVLESLHHHYHNGPRCRGFPHLKLHRSKQGSCVYGAP